MVLYVNEQEPRAKRAKLSKAAKVVSTKDKLKLGVVATKHKTQEHKSGAVKTSQKIEQGWSGVHKLGRQACKRSKSTNNTKSGNTYPFSREFIVKLVRLQKAYYESFLLCTEIYMKGEPAHVCMPNYALVVSNHSCVVCCGKYEWLKNAWKVAQSLKGRNYRSIMHIGTYLIILRISGSAYVWIKKSLRVWKLHMLKLNVAVNYTLKCKWAWNVRERQCMGRNFS